MIYTDRFAVSGPGLNNFSFPDDQVLMVVGDSHGQADALRGVLEGLGRMVTMGKRRTLVFLGDFIDRGPDSMGCLNTALNDGAALANADEVVFLPGNHELLLADTLDEMAKGGAGAYNSVAGLTWLNNGGMAFLADEWEKLDREMPKDIVQAVLEFGETLPHPGFNSFSEMVRSWPSHFKMGDILCVHAGLAPKHPHSYTLDLPQAGHLGNGGLDRGYHDRHWSWIRDVFLRWQGGWPECGTKGADGSLVVHGHTVPEKATPRHLEHGEDVFNVFSRMATNARICVDGGAARGTGVAATMFDAKGGRILFEPVMGMLP